MKLSCVLIRSRARESGGSFLRRCAALRLAGGPARRRRALGGYGGGGRSGGRGRGGRVLDLRKGVQLAFGFRHLALDGVLESPRGILHGAPELAQLLQLDLAVNVGLDVVDVTLQPAEQMAQRARNAGQPLRPDDDERHDRNHHQFGESDVEHGEVKKSGSFQKKKAGTSPGVRMRAKTPQVFAFSLTSASMVRPVTWAAAPPSPGLSSEDFMPSLKPRTAPPRSAPILRSFLVPKTSRTIRSTTSQCQMLHRLPADTSGVDDRAETVGRPLLARQARRRGEDLAEERLLAHAAVGERIDVLFGDDHEMHRGKRVDVVEGEDVGVLVDFLAGDLAPHDLAEDASFRIHLYFRSASARRPSARAAFSSIPEMPSRRRSSASTSAGRNPYCASMIRQ